MAYSVQIGQDAQGDLDAVSAADYGRLVQAINDQLTYEPTKETRNRKPMQPVHAAGQPAPASWELRVQPYRVYYNVNQAEQRVDVVRVARKDRETARPAR